MERESCRNKNITETTRESYRSNKERRSAGRLSPFTLFVKK